MRLVFFGPDTSTETVLACGVLQVLAERYSKVTIVSPASQAEWYAHAPGVEEVWAVTAETAESVAGRLATVNADLCVAARWWTDSVMDGLVGTCEAKEKLAFGNRAWGPGVRVAASAGRNKLECQRHRDLLAALDITIEQVEPAVWTGAAERARVAELMAEHGLESRRFLVALGEGGDAGMLCDAVEPLCRSDGYRLVLLGKKDPSEPCSQAADLRGRVSPLEAAELLRHAALAIGYESELAHVACAVGCMNVVLLKGEQFGRFLPYSRLTSAVSLPLECLNCGACRYGERYCATLIAPEVVEGVARETLARPGRRCRLYLQAPLFHSKAVPPGLFAMSPDVMPPMLYDVIWVADEQTPAPKVAPSQCGCPVSLMRVPRRPA
jgi:ADP-heptose:LPS heptosyltransferase